MSLPGLGRHAHPKQWACPPDIGMLALSTIIVEALLRRLTEEGYFFCELTKRLERDIMLMY